MIRTGAVTRSSPESLEQLQHRRTFFFHRCRRLGLQLRCGRRTLREGNYVEQEVLEGKHVKRALVRGRHWHLSKGHQSGEVKMLQHARYVHGAPSSGG